MDLGPAVRIVIPVEGMNKAVAKRLLSVAGHPNQVQVVTYPEFGYRVPLDVFERFEALGDFGPEAPSEPKTFTDGDSDLNALKKRGRPRKSAPAKAEEEN